MRGLAAPLIKLVAFALITMMASYVLITTISNAGYGEQVSYRAEFTDVAGLAGSTPVSVSGGPSVFVTGAVDLDAAAFARILSGPDGIPVARAIVLHELGHLVGLDHVSDPGQLMYPEASGVADFAAGDLTGLARLGAGACVPEV